MKLFCCGDIHNPIDVSKLNMFNWPLQKELTKEDILIVLGDYGLIWDKDWSKEELWWAKWYTNKKCTVCFVDGNHENFNRINKLEEVDFYGGKAGVAYSDDNGTIYHLKRGEIFTFEDKKVLIIGGASSVDKHHRKENISWWPEEELSKEDEANAVNNLEEIDYKVDFILTHTCPTDIAQQLTNEIVKTRGITSSFLDFVQKFTEFKGWHFGHYHVSRNIGKYFCHYNWYPYRII